MKNIFIICFYIFTSSAFAKGNDFYTILNSTEHVAKVTMNFWSFTRNFALQEALTPSECIRIYKHYDFQSYEYDYYGLEKIIKFTFDEKIKKPFHSLFIKWIFLPSSLSIKIDDESAYERFLGLDLMNYEVMGESNSLLKFFDTFSLIHDDVPNKRDRYCRIFIPEKALFVGGDGNTYLHDAILDGDIGKVEELLENKAERSLKNSDGITPIELAIQEGNSRIVKILRYHGAR